jgi:hypothetical protein
MPKKIITKKTLLIAFHELDKWTGKLTWERYSIRLAETLGVKRISRHTLLSYPSLVEAFKNRKSNLKEVQVETLNDMTLNEARGYIDTLEAKVQRLELQVERQYEQFVRWQHNAYMLSNVDMKELNRVLDKPLTKLNRR